MMAIYLKASVSAAESNEGVSWPQTSLGSLSLSFSGMHLGRQLKASTSTLGLIYTIYTRPSSGTYSLPMMLQ